MLQALVVVMAVVHVYIFCLESIMWGKPATNRVFRVSDKDAQTLRTAMFNQGFYNLFLAVALLMGFFWASQPGQEVAARTLCDYAAGSILGAGVVLWLSDAQLIRAALVQALPAAAYWALRLAGLA